MGAYARVGDADVMPGLRPEPLWPWHGHQGGRRQPTGADRLVGRRAFFSLPSTFVTGGVATSRVPMCRMGATVGPHRATIVRVSTKESYHGAALGLLGS